jgi:pimeloyl-ACP methyl ester carboxylesterase
MPERFVLVHGSWHGGWAWDAVRERLDTAGHRTLAPTLAGHGAGAARAGVHHADCVDSVVAAIEEADLEEITLVGHSFGGSIIAKVAERIPERLARLIFFTAFVLASGESIVDRLPAAQVAEFDARARESDDNTVPCPWEVFRDFFMQDADSDHARAVWSRLAPQPYATWTDKLDLDRFYALDLPRAYVACRDDLALDPGAWHPTMSSRLGDFTLVEIDGSHEAMFTRPADVADAFLEVSGSRRP